MNLGLIITLLGGEANVKKALAAVPGFLRDYKNSIELFPGETQTAIISYEDKGKMFFAIATFDEKNTLKRTLKAEPVEDFLINILKGAKE